MATKKEIKIAEANSVADNVFRMQMNDPSRTRNTPGTFKAKDQKVMAMSTMYNTHDPDGVTVDSIRQDEFEVPRYMGSPEFQAAFGEADKAGLSVFEFPKGSGKMFTTKKGPATETHYLESVDTDTFEADSNQPAFDRNFDAVVKPDLPGANLEKFTYKKKGDSKPGMVDTFTSYDTRQAQRKAIVEARKQKRAKLKALRAKKRAGGIKDETMEFGGLGPDLSGKKVTKSKKQVFKEAKRKIKQKAAEQRSAAMERISAQGQAQRAAGKNPATSTEFDPNQAAFPMKVMQFRKKNKK
jgi:hypothetical protein